MELYANGVTGDGPARHEMTARAGAVGGANYRAAVPATRSPADYTVRVIPHRDGVAIPLEDPHILWQRLEDASGDP